MGHPASDDMIVCTVPSTGPLEEETVKFTILNSDGVATGKALKVSLFSEGRLGSLSGGLLNVADFRKLRSHEEIADLPRETVAAQIAAIDEDPSLAVLWFQIPC